MQFWQLPKEELRKEPTSQARQAVALVQARQLSPQEVQANPLR